MSIKKTIVISVLFHIVFFSAALLFSAGLFKGSGKRHDERVFFVKLEVENNEANNNEITPEMKKSVQKKIRAAEEMGKNKVVAVKPPVIVTSEVTLKKAPEPLEKEMVTDDELFQESPDDAKADETPASGENIETSENQDEMMQASLTGAVPESSGLRNRSAGEDLSPAMIELIGDAIERVKIYPVLARKRGIEGTVYVSFRINESGRPDEIEIKKSSGHSILDSATVKVVQKAAPYPHINSRVEVPVAYRLKSDQRGF